MNKTELVKLALMCAASGRHNVLFVGGPGVGKSLALQKLETLLPPLTEEEAMSVNRIRSLAGLMLSEEKSEKEWLKQPFRLPHMTASLEGMCGGGPNCRPGEITLAHNGVLFLDEAAEFRSSVLQLLRVPIESKSITLSRAGRSTVYPADFQLLMSANPCPCGNYGSKNKVCLCSAHSIELYWKKFSAPLLDRVDIVLCIDKEDNLPEEMDKWDWEEMKDAVLKSVERQRKRGCRNARFPVEKMSDQYLSFNESAWKKVQDLTMRYDWSARRRAICIKLAKTIADLNGNDIVSEKEVDLAFGLCKKTSFEDMD